MAQGRISRVIPEFNSYINNTDDHLQSSRSGSDVYVLLLLETAEADQWTDFRVEWRDTLYPLWSNDDTKTTTVVQLVENFMETFREFAQPLLNRMAASPNVIVQDEVIMNFKSTRSEPVRPTEPIVDTVYLKVIPLGGGGLRIKARTAVDESRPSIPDDAKAVEIRWLIGLEPPADVSECPEHFTSTRASFRLNVGAQNHNKNIYAFARWVDTSNQSRAGDWTDMNTSGVL